ncbi:hypothetical protein SACC_29880 [Saccharolobus caldissimus]|uniref:Uncharacterized protein n=1 Tax=Saccharolobus caldissimus TaxID=1702097 RepID=A0AAQ4CVZ0_9CREN|nr:hypothetical protein SACC_29880 [Saccharolobus caldissimus]
MEWTLKGSYYFNAKLNELRGMINYGECDVQ